VVIRKTTGTAGSVLYGSPSGKEAIEREQPFRKDLSAEAEVSRLSEAATRKRLVKIEQVGIDYAMVICRVWRLAVVLELLVFRVYKWRVKPISNQKSAYSHSFTC
jgi:hypothetical protein